MIVDVFGGPLGLDLAHLGIPRRSLGADFDPFRVPRKASGAKICTFVIEHFNFLGKRKTAATWSRPAEIFRSKYSFLRTSIAFFKTKPIEGETKHSRKQVPKRRFPVRRIQPGFFKYVFARGLNNKVCLHGAIRVGLSGGTSLFFGIGGCGFPWGSAAGAAGLWNPPTPWGSGVRGTRGVLL